MQPGEWPKMPLRYLIEETNMFVTVAELVTSRGLITGRSGRKVLHLARELSNHPQVHALSITDNPGGNAMIGADAFGTDLISRGQEVIIHLSCKDWNRNALQSRGWQLASEGFNNILALSGDFPTDGYQGQAGAVFDIDSVALLKMYSEMNAGMELTLPNGQMRKMEQTHFYLGAVVNNQKRYEREVMPQYFKLAKKIECGASFIITQIGYDSRKHDELLKYMALHNLRVPVLANVFVLSLPVARFFHADKIPGCVVTDELLALIEKQAQSQDKGKTFLLEFAAKQCAVAKGLGFRGVYLGGHWDHEDFTKLLEMIKSFGENDWKEFAREIQFHQPDEFYYFEPDPDTGLSSTEINRAYLQSKSPEALASLRSQVPLSYKLNRLTHDKVFVEDTLGFRAGKAISEAVEKSNGVLQRTLHALEYGVKIAAFDCRDCGDCSLPDIAYLCPESQCAKNQRNGPCGGTRRGKCEVGEKDCIWALSYDRLKAYGEEENMLKRPVVIKNAALKGTSGWMNKFLGRDHSRKRS